MYALKREGVNNVVLVTPLATSEGYLISVT